MNIGAKLSYSALPGHAARMISDKGYDSDDYRTALKAKGIVPFVPQRKGRELPVSFDKSFYRQRHKTRNMFGKFKYWRHIHTRYDRCAQTFWSAICITATVIVWLSY